MSANPPGAPVIVPGRVSIVLPAWNSRSTIASAVDSCLAQTYCDVEVVVVNDGSTDDTRQILESYGDRIRLVNRANGGVAAARITGVGIATGEFIAWMDNDDILHPDRVRLGMMVLAARPDVAIVCSDFSAFLTPDIELEPSHIATYYSAVGRLGGMAAILPERFELPAGTIAGCGPIGVRTGEAFDSLLEGNFIHPPTVLTRRVNYDRAGPLDTALRLASEYEQAIRISRFGKVAYIEHALLRYRRSDSQLSSYTTCNGHLECETAYVLEKVWRLDPAVYGRRREFFHRKLAHAYVEASAEFAASDRPRAFRLLMRGLRHRPRPLRALRSLSKIVIPRPLVKVVKRILAPVLPAGANPPHNPAQGPFNTGS